MTKAQASGLFSPLLFPPCSLLIVRLHKVSIDTTIFPCFLPSGFLILPPPHLGQNVPLGSPVKAKPKVSTPKSIDNTPSADSLGQPALETAPSMASKLSILDRFNFTGDRFDLTGDRFDLAGDRFNLAGDRFDLAGDRFNFTGDRFNLAGDRFDLAGDRFDLAGDRFNLAGDRFNLAGDQFTFTIGRFGMNPPKKYTQDIRSNYA
jgi:hypothetical protein